MSYGGGGIPRKPSPRTQTSERYMEFTDVTAAAVTPPRPPTLEQLEAAEQDLVTEIDQQRQKAYDEIFRDTELARDPAVIRDRYRWIGYEIACLGRDQFQQILKVPFAEMHLQGIFPGADRIWQLLYARVVTPEITPTEKDLPFPPELLRVTDLHQGFAPPNSNRGDNFFGVSYEMVLGSNSPRTTESFLQPKPLHQYWVKCDFAPEFFRGCWLPELLMRTYPPYIKELNRIRRIAIEDLTQDALNACNKRLSLMGSVVVAVVATPSETPKDSGNMVTLPPVNRLPRPDPIKIAAQLWENPKLTEIHIRVLRRICGNIVQCLLRGVTPAQLFETLDGDPAVVIGSFLVTMQLPERSPAVIKQVIDRKLSLGNTGSCFQYQPGFRCLVAGFPRAVWLPVSLFAWVAARECRCGGGGAGTSDSTPETCHCKWRNMYAGYDFVDRLLRG